MNEFLAKFDDLYKNGRIEEAKDYIDLSLNEAIKNKNHGLIITILNEGIGFYRDLSLFEESNKLAQSLEKIMNITSLDNKSKAICYINIGNSFRASKQNEKAINYFIDALDLYKENNIEDSNLNALLNNLALCYMNLGEYEEAIKYLKIAIKDLDDKDIRVGISNINMALSYIALNDLKNAFISLTLCAKIFENNESDFHYMFYLEAMGRFMYLKESYKEAKFFFEKAIAYMKKRIGNTSETASTLEELYKVYDKLEMPHHEKGLSLSKRFYDKYIKGKINENVAIVSIGFGSDKYGFDDTISEDHDFHPDILIISNNKIDLDNAKMRLEMLPNMFERYYKEDGFVKFFTLDEFLSYINLDVKKPTDISASLLLNGIILSDKFNIIKNVRICVNEALEYFYIDKLVKAFLNFGQLSDYNLKRAYERKDVATFKLLMSKIPESLVDLVTILENKLIIHDKWKLEVIKNTRLGNLAIDYILELNEENVFELTKNITIEIINKMIDLGLIASFKKEFIEDYKDEVIAYAKDYYSKLPLVKKICEFEWDMFTNTINIGHRAACQDNYEYFQMMRKSQALAWSFELLNSYLNDLAVAKENGYNIIAFKYGFMEESTDLESFNKIKDRLPTISESRKKIQEEVIKVQLEELISFYSRYNSVEDKMRTTYSSTDTLNNTSYETYLRGELSSYSDKTLTLYARNLIEYENKNDNYVERVIKNSYRIMKIDIKTKNV